MTMARPVTRSNAGEHTSATIVAISGWVTRRGQLVGDVYTGARRGAGDERDLARKEPLLSHPALRTPPPYSSIDSVVKKMVLVRSQ